MLRALPHRPPPLRCVVALHGASTDFAFLHSDLCATPGLSLHARSECVGGGPAEAADTV